MSETNIPILPDVCLWVIFKYLPTNDLINGIGLVCTHWRLLLDRELRARHSLVLYSKWDDEREIKHSLNEHYDHLLERIRKDDDGSPLLQLPTVQQFKFNWLDFDLSAWKRQDQLWWNMPNITDLHLEYAGEDCYISLTDFNFIIRLIRRWSANLISLKLKIRLEYVRYGGERGLKAERNVQTMLMSLFDELNGMTALRHLYLCVLGPRHMPYDHRLPDSERPIRFPDNRRFTFLSHLHTFCFQTNSIINERECLLASLQQYGRTNNHLKICLHKQITSAQMLQVDRRVGQKFTQISPSFLDCELNRRFCARFTNITSLELSFNCAIPSELLKMAQGMRLLPYLITLKLACYIYLIGNENLVDTPEPADYPQVHSVRLLIVKMNTKSHCDTSKLHIANIFPNVQVLHLWHASRECTVCGYKIESDDLSSNIKRSIPPKSTIAECMRLAREPLRACVNLHTIEHNTHPLDTYFGRGQKRLITVDQL